MNWFKTLFKRTKQTSPIPMPPYDEIVKSLYDKELVCSDELKICKVIYNKDNSKRFVILESKKGFFKYTYEEICVFDELDWNDHYCYIENIKPGWWEPKDSSFAYSFFGTEDEALSALERESEYKQFFEQFDCIFFVNTSQNKKHFERSAFCFGTMFALTGK